MGLTLGIDIGGTFTDCIAIESGKGTRIGKALSTPPDFHLGFVDAIDVVARAGGHRGAAELLRRTDSILHGCTVGSNALVQHRTARVGLLTSRGHRDSIFAMQSGRRLRALAPEVIARVSSHVKPDAIVPRELVWELDERVTADGIVLVALDETQVRTRITQLLDAGVEAIAISLLWSVANDAHERLITQIAYELAPDLYISTASRVIPRAGEYERTVATVINALIGPEMDRYLSQIEGSCEELGYKGAIRIMTCTGGLLSTAEARALPVLTIGSGPVAGLIGARKLSALDGDVTANVITADMGGTTLDVGILEAGVPLNRPTSWYDQYEYYVPTLDVRSVGSGGGSIVRYDELAGTLKVGPQSAGSVPGPVCYGRCGHEPTVTDADVVAGFLNPDSFLGGSMPLDIEAARRALERVGQPLELNAEQTACAALRIVDNQMADAIRLVTVNQGLDPREFELYACGGAGAVHAAAIASELSIPTIVVPLSNLASGWSAFGVAGAEPLVVEELAQPLREPFEPETLNSLWRRLEGAALERLDRQGVTHREATITRHIDMRYSLQVNEVEIEAPGGLYDLDSISTLIERFEKLYSRRYGPDSGYAAAGFAITSLRVRGRGLARELSSLYFGADHKSTAVVPTGYREVRFSGRNQPLRVALYDGSVIHPGVTLCGPAIVELPDTSIVVPSGAAMRVDQRGSARIALSIKDT